MQTEFKQYIKMVGRGQRAGELLNKEQAFNAMQQMLQDKVSPEQLGAFLMLMRVREETAEELAGFVDACRTTVQSEFTELNIDLDLGCYAGKRRHLPWFLLAVMAFAQSGRRVFIHGTAEPESQRLYVKEALEFFGIKPATDKQSAEQQLNKFGFCYVELADLNKPLDKLIQLRALFGLRSAANTLARMLNPSKAKHSLHGVHHRNFDIRHVDAAQMCNDSSVVCFRGEGGEVEFNPEREVTLHYFKQGQKGELKMPALLENWQIKPRELDLAQLQQVWLNQVDNNYAAQAVLGTLAIFLLTTDAVATVEEATQQAKDIWQHRSATWPLG